MLLLSKFRISGHSMEPDIKQNETVLASSLIYLFKNPKVNDIVAFKVKNGEIYIKRITKIENEKYYVGGDNKNDSYDSRQFGFVKKENILGKVIFKL